ncbi:MAG: pyroglutamyl-peptidase I [Rudaea sp.]|uniref:pyroglutamyl-peptidase I n=1 Tax=Rudaea sp. TaxID=2136325 RepID=UPI0039E5E76B
MTGFDPFGGEAINPSFEIARALDGEIVAGHHIVGAMLPTEFARSLPALDALLRRHRPALVVALGQAGGRAGISLERVAINLIDARVPDNAGDQPVDVRIVENAANAYFSTLPVKAMLAALREADIPAELSQTAGGFVCNQVFYGLMHRLARARRRVRGGFVHVPYLPEQARKFEDAPSLPMEIMIAATRLCVRTALTTESDLSYAAGTLH